MKSTSAHGTARVDSGASIPGRRSASRSGAANPLAVCRREVLAAPTVLPWFRVNRRMGDVDRRQFLAAGIGAAYGGHGWAAQPAPGLLLRPIPSSGERIASIGMGTWLTFDAGESTQRRAALAQVLRLFFDAGGTLIDSSPMYGSAERAVGDLLAQIGRADRVFSATKVWTSGRSEGERQMRRSLEYWRLPKLDLIQVHNLLDWQTQLRLLREWQAAGRVRYVGVTTSHGRRHDELEALMRRERLDFVQFGYSVADRSAEQRLLPLAADRGIAVIANRPFHDGGLFARVRDEPLPDWAAEFGATNWAQVFLKFVISHPAVTCAIPATSKPAHAEQNMGALRGPLPDAAARLRIARLFD